jgi:hypothetical protein
MGQWMPAGEGRGRNLVRSIYSRAVRTLVQISAA